MSRLPEAHVTKRGRLIDGKCLVISITERRPGGWELSGLWYANDVRGAITAVELDLKVAFKILREL